MIALEQFRQKKQQLQEL